MTFNNSTERENIDDRVLTLDPNIDYKKLEGIKKLREQFTGYKKKENISRYLPIDPIKVYVTIEKFKKLCEGKASGKLLDLGSGEGFMLAAFTLAGYDCYGIEKDPEMASLSQIKLSSLPKPPQIIRGDYFDPALNETAFPDGARISDMDFIASYSYTRAHWLDLFMNVLLRMPIRIGTIINLGDCDGYVDWEKNRRMFNNSGFIYTNEKFAFHTMRKIGEPNEIALKETEVITKWLNAETEYLRK